MITYTIMGDNVQVSDSVREHIENHFKKFEKFVDSKDNHEIFVTLSKITVHQREDSFRVEVKFQIHSENYFVSANNVDIFSAIDKAKDELFREITKKQGRKRTLFHRGARKFKNFAKGMMSFKKAE